MSTNYTKNPNQDPAKYWLPINPAEEKDLTGMIIVAVFATGEGTIVMEDEDGNVASVPFAAGQERMWVPKKILANGTDATGIFILYNK